MQQVLGAVVWLGSQGGEQPGDLGPGERDLPWWRWPGGVFGGCGDGEECQRGHGEGPPRLHPAEPARDPAHQLIEQPRPPGRVYAGLSGHRTVIESPYNPR